MKPWDSWKEAEEPAEPWASDPDAWRGEQQNAPLPFRSEPWPQLDAGPLYWMWCELLERERGIDQ